MLEREIKIFNALLEVVEEYGKDFKVSFGVNKSLVMVIEGHEREEKDRWN